MARIPLQIVVLATLSITLGAACAQPVETEDETGEATASALTELDFQTLRVALPVTKDASVVFASEKQLREYFGTSCGSFCTTPWKGQLPFTFGEREYVVLISRAKSAPGKGFDIYRAHRAGNPKWIHTQSCPNKSGVPYSLIKVTPNWLTIFSSDDGPATPCREPS